MASPTTSLISAPTIAPRSSFNPLHVRGTALPANVLLMAKLITLCFILTGQVSIMSSHFLPFFPVFNHMGSPITFHYVLQAIFLVAALLLFLNRYVRIACFVLGMAMFVSILSQRELFANNRTFCACALLLSSLCSIDTKPWLLRYQVVIVYFGAALNKLLEPDWRSGQFFVHWFGHVHHPQLWAAVTSIVPEMRLGQMISWSVILVEFVLVIGFMVPRLYRSAIWLGAAYHTGLLMHSAFTMFYFAILASYLAFVEWPERAMPVLYDSDCGFCQSVRRWFQRVDLEKAFAWVPFQRAPQEWGISIEASSAKLHLVLDDEVYRGFDAFKLLVLFNPVSYFVFATLMAGQPDFFRYRRWLGIIALAIFTPKLTPAGDVVYNIIAGNRHFFSRRGCSIPEADERLDI
jgi:predicted DCC family thiol-disulfide oxidoreductase YuxK